MDETPKNELKQCPRCGSAEVESEGDRRFGSSGPVADLPIEAEFGHCPNCDATLIQTGEGWQVFEEGAAP
jgi:NMD protein affecting ribosome stability and mRNA decay